eukprot:EG_transcript_29845
MCKNPSLSIPTAEIGIPLPQKQKLPSAPQWHGNTESRCGNVAVDGFTVSNRAVGIPDCGPFAILDCEYFCPCGFLKPEGTAPLGGFSQHLFASQHLPTGLRTTPGGGVR